MPNDIFDFVEDAPIHELPAHLEGQFESILKENSVHGSLGQFKKILPISEQLCVACVAKENAPQLESEMQMLMLMQKYGLPAITCYSELFDISQGNKAVIMEYVTNAVLLDAKFPSQINKIMLPILMGFQITTGKENWMQDFYAILEKMKTISDLNALNTEKIIAKAKNIAKQTHQLIENLTKNNICIGDLQILLADDGNIKIIDPLDILRFEVLPGQPPKFFKIDPQTGKEAPFHMSAGYLDQIQNGMKMLSMVENICSQISKCSDRTLNTEYNSFISKMKDEYERQNPSQFQRKASIPERRTSQNSALHEKPANKRKEPMRFSTTRKDSAQSGLSKEKSEKPIEKLDIKRNKPES